VKLSVIIPTYNRCDLLGRTLPGLLDQTAPASEYEILVVDDGSTDNTPQVVSNLDAPESRIRYFRQENKGPAAARNYGVREAKGEIILFTGDDCIPDRKLVAEHLRVHRQEGDVGVLGHIAWHPELTITPFMAWLEEGVQFGFKLIKDPDHVTAWCFYTSNCSVQRHRIQEVGGFDEEFRFAAFEDIELAYRMQQHGLRILYRPSALTYHHHQVELHRYLVRQRLSGQSAVVFARKHPELKGALGIRYGARIAMALEFYKALTEYAYALGVRDALRGQEPLPDTELEALWRDPAVAAASDGWQREIFAGLTAENLTDAVELARLRKQTKDTQEEWVRVTSRRFYRWSEAAAKLGWRFLRAVGPKRGERS
jgi:GT2 family glycosyltransferase